MSNPRIGLVAFGEVGTGKSALCNTLVGSDGSAFVESEKTESQTLETIGKKGKYGNQDTFLIDTPGLGEAERNDAVHLELSEKRKNHSPWTFVGKLPGRKPCTCLPPVL